MNEKTFVENDVIDRRSTTPLILIDENREIVDMNAAAETLTGWTIGDVAGRRHCYELLSCRDEHGERIDGKCPGRRCFTYGSTQRDQMYTITDSHGHQVDVVSDYQPLKKPVNGRRMAVIRMETLSARAQRLWQMRQPYELLIFVLVVAAAAAFFLIGKPYG